MENGMPGEDEILVVELGRLGAAGAQIGQAVAAGLFGGHGGAADGLAGGRGAIRAARRLRTDVHEIEIDSPASADEARARVTALIRATGRLIGQADSEDGAVVICGVVGAGAMNMNPAVLTITVSPDGGHGTTVHVRGAAKEGLIKQHAGEKAARRFAFLLEADEQ